MSKNILIVLFVALCSFPSFAYAVQTGFAEKSLWYSSEEFVVDETVTIHTLVVNSEDTTLSGVVRLFDRDVLLGEKNISVEKNDAKVMSFSWKVTSGEHQFSAHFDGASLRGANGASTQITPTLSETKKDIVYVKKTPTKDTSSQDANTLSAQATLDKDSIVGEVSKAADFLKEKTPDGVEVKISETTVKIEDFRETWEEYFEEKKENEQVSLEILNKYYEDRLKAKEEADPDNYVKQSYVDSSGENILKKPFHYIAIFFYSLLVFILANALLFYGISALLVFLIIRTIWRSVRK